LFIISDAFVFGALLVTRFYLLGDTRPHLEQGLGLIVTSVLLISSFFMNRAEVQISLGNRKAFVTNIAVTIVLGIGFLVGVVGFEWTLAPFRPSDGAEGAVFYMMTGMHAFHVLTGVILLIFTMIKGMKGLYTPDRHWGVEAAANYWHFVDVVWIFFYPALYLIGTVIK
jgi:cytochrome c oxidase subunit 3